MSTDPTEIVAVLSEYLPLEPETLVAKSNCPFHDDHDSSLRVWHDRQEYACAVCGAKGDVVDFVARYEQISREQAASQLSER